MFGAEVQPGQYAEYQADPAGFAEKVLGETLTEDVKAADGIGS